MAERNAPSAYPLMRVTVLPVLLGLAAGLTGGLLADAYLVNGPAASYENPLIQIGQPTPPSASPLSDADLSVDLRRIDIPLYPRKAAAGTDLADQARAPYEALGYATVITSDGWLATHSSVLASGAALADVAGRLLVPTAQVADPRTGIVFLKVDASALPVSGFEDTEALKDGTAVYAAGAEGLFSAARFGGAVLPDRKAADGALHDADKFSLAYRLDRALDVRAAGGAVMTASGNLAGILAPGGAGADTFVPIHLLRPILAEVFHGQAPARALLGAHYLTPGETAFSAPDQGTLAGVRLSGSRAAGIPAVRAGSAAARSGLLEGDVIQRVDGVDTASVRDLAELIAQYAPGAKAHFEFLRNGEHRALDVTFE